MSELGNRSIWLPFVVSILLLVVLLHIPPASALELDITNDPNKDFFIGYRKHYNEDCEVRWWESRWDTEYIMSPDECSGISNDRVYNDMIKAMEYVKSTTKFENFADYFRAEEKKDAAKGLYWDYMYGYQYKYSDNCTVGWSATGVFIVPPTCQNLSNEKLEADAIKSIKYAKSRSKAENFSNYYDELKFLIDVTDDPNRDFFEGYRMTYKDKGMKVICDVKYWRGSGGRSYLRSDDSCDGISKQHVYNDAVRIMHGVKTKTYAKNFSEYLGEDSQGNKTERAKLRYRCINTDNRLSGYLFKPEESPSNDGWYRLYYYPDGHKPYEYEVGIWRELSNGLLTINTGSGPVAVNMSEVRNCYNY